MKCNNCGTKNDENAKFCVSCGHNLETNLAPKQKKEERVQPTGTPASSFSFDDILNFLKMLLSLIMKPVTTLKERLDEYSSSNKPWFVALGVSIFTMLLYAFYSAKNAVKVVDSFLWLGDGQTTWVWSNLKNVNWFKIIVGGIISYFLMIVVVAGIYYLSSLIGKKKPNFGKLLVVASITSLLSNVIALVIIPIFSMISVVLSGFIAIIGVIYVFIIFVYGMNLVMDLEDNDKLIYVNAVAMSVISLISYIIIVSVIGSAFSGLY